MHPDNLADIRFFMFVYGEDYFLTVRFKETSRLFPE